MELVLEQESTRALAAFLGDTTSRREQDLALRALVLHMLEGHTPRAFARWKLGPLLEEAMGGLRSIPAEFPVELPPDDGMARVDALYLFHERGLPSVLPEPGAFLRYLQHLDQEGYSIYAWLMAELMKPCGLRVPLEFPERPFKAQDRMLDIYWVTHLYLLDTRYLHAPLRSPRASEWTQDLLTSAAWLLEERRFDLAAEVAICLQLAGAAGSEAYQQLLAALRRQQGADGRVVDVTLGEGGAETVAHTTGASLLVFAGVGEAAGG